MAIKEVQQQQLPPNKIAFIIDNEVVDILHVDDRLAAIFLSQPEIMDVTEEHQADSGIFVGSTYNPNTKVFTPPADIAAQLAEDKKAAEAIQKAADSKVEE